VSDLNFPHIIFVQMNSDNSKEMGGKEVTKFVYKI